MQPGQVDLRAVEKRRSSKFATRSARAIGVPLSSLLRRWASRASLAAEPTIGDEIRAILAPRYPLNSRMSRISLSMPLGGGPSSDCLCDASG